MFEGILFTRGQLSSASGNGGYRGKESLPLSFNERTGCSGNGYRFLSYQQERLLPGIDDKFDSPCLSKMREVSWSGQQVVAGIK